ncbi:MAG: polyhydroxyalkanoic acid system family protein [Candidatus Tectimicrobiota bacterium]
MPLITFSLQHRQTFEEARQRLATAVAEVHRQCGALVQHVTWSADQTQVRLEGVGYWMEMRVDAQEVHVAGDLAGLGGLLGGPLVQRLTQLVQQTFQRQLP